MEKISLTFYFNHKLQTRQIYELPQFLVKSNIFIF